MQLLSSLTPKPGSLSPSQIIKQKDMQNRIQYNALLGKSRGVYHTKRESTLPAAYGISRVASRLSDFNQLDHPEIKLSANAGDNSRSQVLDSVRFPEIPQVASFKFSINPEGSPEPRGITARKAVEMKYASMEMKKSTPN